MIGVLVLLLVVLAAGIGAGAGELMSRRRRRLLHDLRRHIEASAGRANHASATIEKIAPEWPSVTDRVERLDATARRALLESQAARRTADETAARMVELEQAIAQTFSITLAQRGA
jgi:hypothetical protein